MQGCGDSVSSRQRQSLSSQCATVSDHSLHAEPGFLCLIEQILTEVYKANKTLEHLVA